MSFKDIFEWIWTANLLYLIGFLILLILIGGAFRFLGGLFLMLRDFKNADWKERLITIVGVAMVLFFVFWIYVILFF